MTKRYIYFGCSPDQKVMKVGISKQPRKRVKGMGLLLIESFEGDYELEQMIHGDLKPYCIHGEFYSYPKANLYLMGLLRRETFPDTAESAA